MTNSKRRFECQTGLLLAEQFTQAGKELYVDTHVIIVTIYCSQVMSKLYGVGDPIVYQEIRYQKWHNDESKKA